MLTVICPSRGRPGAAAEVIQTFTATAVDPTTLLVFVVDPDDTSFTDYPTHLGYPGAVSRVLPEKPARSGMLGALNMALTVPGMVPEQTTVVGFIGDDHRFRTMGWDVLIGDMLEQRNGIAYANDLFQGERLPTNWFVSRPIVDVFGMGLPTLQHLYIDDYWKTFGTAAGCLTYLPDVVIEHMHPLAGKGQWDEGYMRVNTPAMYAADEAAFQAWVKGPMPTDVDRLRQIVG